MGEGEAGRRGEEGGGGGNGSLPTLNGGGHIVHIYNQVVWYFSKQGTAHIGFVHCLQIIFVCFRMPNCRLLQTMQSRFFPFGFWPG